VNDAPAAFPPGGRRLVVYVVYDRRGGVEDFVPSALAGFRPHADRLMAVVNGSLTEEARRTLASVVDDILVRPNEGLDIWAHKTALDALGDAVEGFDEVVLTNDTWFGPVGDLGPVLDRMGARPVDFWGMNDHAAVPDDPVTGRGIPAHLQSFWIAVRGRMLRSEAWRAYWRDLPPMPRYEDAVTRHELRFTAHFEGLGFRSEAAFPHERYDSENAAFFNAEELVVDGSPLLKRKPFHLWPPTMDRHAAIGRWTMEAAAERGTAPESLLPSLVRNSPLRDLHTDLALQEVLLGAGVADDGRPPLRVAVVAHAGSVDDLPAAVACAEGIPGVTDLIVTTPDAGVARAIEAAGETPAQHGWRRAVVVAPAADDTVAFLTTCAERVVTGEHDLVVKIRPTSAGGVSSAERVLGDLLRSPAHAAELVDLFRRDPGLGLVFPPPSRVGDPLTRTLPDGGRARLAALAAELGIAVPLDGLSLLAPEGVFVARPEALRLLTGASRGSGRDERTDLWGVLPAYAAAELGFHTRTVLSAEDAAAAYTALEASVDAFSALVPGSLPRKVELLLRAGPLRGLRPADLLRMHVRIHHPAAVRRARRLLDAVRGLLRRVRRMPR
jgi:lipopolysaccharide biosynthesis protein